MQDQNHGIKAIRDWFNDRSREGTDLQSSRKAECLNNKTAGVLH